MTKQNTPLKHWKWLLACIVIFVVGHYWFYLRPSAQGELDIKELSQLEQDKAKIQDHSLKIVLFGSSRLASGVESTSYFSKKMSESLNKKVDIIFYSTPNASLADLLGSPEVYIELTKIAPDIIFIQSDLLLYQPSRPELPQGRAGANILKRAAKNDDRRIFKGYAIDEDQWSPKIDSNKYETYAKYYFERNKARKIPFENENIAYITKKLLDKQTVLVAIDFPYPVAVEQLRNQKGFRNNELNTLKLLKEQYGIKYVSNQDRFHFADFHDFVHMNSSGKTRYSDWLVTQIINTVKE